MSTQTTQPTQPSTGTERSTERIKVAQSLGKSREHLREAQAILWEQARQVEADLITREQVCKKHKTYIETDEMWVALSQEANALHANHATLSRALVVLDGYQGQM